MEPIDLLHVLWFFGPAYLADMSPIFAARRAPRLDAPIDGGRRWHGEAILGHHKTWRGIAACILGGVIAYELQRAIVLHSGVVKLLTLTGGVEPVWPGALMGLAVGLGDAVKSFFKRRVGVPPGGTWIPFDQLDFFVAAWLFVSVVHAPPFFASLAIVPIVFVSDILATTVFYHLGLKDTWV